MNMKSINEFVISIFFVSSTQKKWVHTPLFCFLHQVHQFLDVVIPYFVLGEGLFRAFVAVQLGPPSMLDRPFACVFLEFAFQLDVFVGPMEPAWWSNDFVFLLVFHYAMNYIYSTIYFNFLF